MQPDSHAAEKVRPCVIDSMSTKAANALVDTFCTLPTPKRSPYRKMLNASEAQRFHERENFFTWSPGKAPALCKRRPRRRRYIACGCQPPETGLIFPPIRRTRPFSMARPGRRDCPGRGNTVTRPVPKCRVHLARRCPRQWPQRFQNPARAPGAGGCAVGDDQTGGRDLTTHLKMGRANARLRFDDMVLGLLVGQCFDDGNDLAAEMVTLGHAHDRPGYSGE